MPVEALRSEPDAARPDSRRPATVARREAILVAAADLFSRQGYVGTSMNDIGAAVGITGGALYRHFASKHDVLQAVVLRAIDRVVARVNEIVEQSTSPEETLDALVVNLVRATLENRPLVRVWGRERHHLDESTEMVIDREHRLHVAEWVNALTRVRPELSELEKWALVHVVWGSTMWGVEFDGGLDDGRLAALLVQTGRTVLRAPVPAAAPVPGFPPPPR